LGKNASKVDVWSAHPLLNWPPSPSSGRYIGVSALVSALALDKREKNIYAVTAGEPMLLRIPIKEDGSAGQPQTLQPSGYFLLDGVALDANGNIYTSEMLRNEIWVVSPDGEQRILIASKMNAPLDNNAALVLKATFFARSSSASFTKNPRMRIAQWSA
jgi:hypothetical protein